MGYNLFLASKSEIVAKFAFLGVSAFIALPFLSSTALAEEFTVSSVGNSYTAHLNQIADNTAGGFKVYTHDLGPLELPTGMTANNSLVVEDTATATFYMVNSTDISGFANLTPSQRQQVASQHGRFLPILRVGDSMRYDRSYNVANALDGDPSTHPFPSVSETGAVLDLVAAAVVPDPNAPTLIEEKLYIDPADRSVYDNVADLSQIVSDVATAVVVGKGSAKSIVPVTEEVAASLDRSAVVASRGTKESPQKAPAVNPEKVPGHALLDARDFKKKTVQQNVRVEKLLRKDKHGNDVGDIALILDTEGGGRFFGSHAGIVLSNVTKNGTPTRKSTVSIHFQPLLRKVKIDNSTTKADIIVVIEAGAKGLNIDSGRALTCASGAQAALQTLGVDSGARTVRPYKLMKAALDGKLKGPDGQPLKTRVYVRGDKSTEIVLKRARLSEGALGLTLGVEAVLLTELFGKRILDGFMNCLSQDEPQER